MIRVLVVAPNPVVQAGLASLLESGSSVELVGSRSGLEAVSAAVDELQPEVLVADLETRDDEPPGELLAVAAGPDPPGVILLTDDATGGWMTEALRLGARAVLPRNLTASEMLAAVEAAAAGLVVLPRQDLEALLPVTAATSAALPELPDEELTPREREVLGMLAEGLGNKTVAAKLGISEHTVKFHVASIMGKLHASSRTEAVTVGVRRGLVML